MVGVYFSGTGNTKYCIEKFLKALDGEAEALPIEDPAATDAVKNSDEIVFAYPVYYFFRKSSGTLSAITPTYGGANASSLSLLWAYSAATARVVRQGCLRSTEQRLSAVCI